MFNLADVHQEMLFAQLTAQSNDFQCGLSTDNATDVYVNLL